MSGSVQAAVARCGRSAPLIAIFEPQLVIGGPPRPPRRAEGRRTSKRAEPAEGNGERVLVVEDDYFAALSLETGLVEAGYEVLAVVASGEAALEVAGRERPDLVLMDVRLAGDLDGIETACALREKGIRCIFASAHSDPATRERGAAAEPLGWLAKPFSSKEMLAAVAEAMKRLRSN